MDKKELLKEILESCYSELQDDIDKFYKVNGKIEKIKGRIEGRKILSRIVVGTDLTIDTSIWPDEESGIRHFNDELIFLEGQIKTGIEKVNMINKIMLE